MKCFRDRVIDEVKWNRFFDCVFYRIWKVISVGMKYWVDVFKDKGRLSFRKVKRLCFKGNVIMMSREGF